MTNSIVSTFISKVFSERDGKHKPQSDLIKIKEEKHRNINNEN